MSGLYIKGFQLPEKNDLYYVKVECEPGKNPVATIWRKDMLGSMSFGAFEAINVPDHGRLVEADKLEAIAERRYGVINIGHIDDAPTIIPASGKDINAPTKEE